MNWVERISEIKGKDLYSQNSEGLILEYIFYHLGAGKLFLDIGAGDGFILSNTRHLELMGWYGVRLDSIDGHTVKKENLQGFDINCDTDLLSIDIDGNDYHIIDELLTNWSFTPFVIVAEFNPAFTDSRTIKYNSNHEWAGDDYYGFSFEAGKKLAEKHGYEIIFNVANMNLIMLRKDLINVPVPPVTYKQDNFFKASNRPDSDWVFI